MNWYIKTFFNETTNIKPKYMNDQKLNLQSRFGLKIAYSLTYSNL